MDRRRPSSLGRFLGFQGMVGLVNIAADRADSNLGCFRDALKCLLKTGHEKIDVRHDVRVAVEADTHGDCIFRAKREQMDLRRKTVVASLRRIDPPSHVEALVAPC